MGLTIKELIPIGEKILEDGGVEEYKHDAESILGFEIGFDKQKIFMNWTHDVDDAHSEHYFDLLHRRASGEPLQYITGEQYFMGHRFMVDPRVLIPRPETETLAEKAISWLSARAGARAVLELCTGSGALVCSLALACPKRGYTATDISEDALGAARKNAAALGVAAGVTFLRSDLFASIKRGAFGRKFDLIVANPPYIRTGDLKGLQREILCHEPMLALDGGADGLDFYRRIAADAASYTRPGGLLLVEIGYDQGESVSKIFEAAGFAAPEIFNDLAGRSRVVSISA